MKIIDFFIDRPVATSIINILIIILGLIAFNKLPLREYPEIIIPKFTVNVTYPNASLETVESDVTSILEEQLSSIAGIDKIYSHTSTGFSHIKIYFKNDIDMTFAFSQLRDKLSMAKGFLPQDIKEPIIQQGDDKDEEIISFTITSAQYTPSELTHFAKIYVADKLKTLSGVAQVVVWGAPYVMRITINKAKLINTNITIDDIIKTLIDQNMALPAGKLNKEESIQFDLSLHTIKDFENIIVKKEGQSIIYLKDIATITLSTRITDLVRKDSKSSVFIKVIPTTTCNQLVLGDTIKGMLPTIQDSLPKNSALSIAVDRTQFIKASLERVKSTILEAIFLVGLIIIVFLRNLKLALIPIISIPIALIGTFFLMHTLSMSINILTLMALVLAIGLVVDDAIVVLENIHRQIKGDISPTLTTKKATKEISFAIIAMTLTLASVYIPITFYPGIIGKLFKEFAITLAGAVMISGFVALSLTPMMCAKLLKPKTAEKNNFIQNKFKELLIYLIDRKIIIPCITLGLIISSLYLYKTIPQTITPIEDRGFIGAYIERIPGKKIEFFDTYIKQVESIARTIPEMTHIYMFAGDWGAAMPIELKPWEERKRASFDILDELQQKLNTVPSVNAYAWNWNTSLPGLDGFGQPDGIKITIKSFKDCTHIYNTIEKLLNKIRQKSEYSHAYQELQLNTITHVIDIDNYKASLLGITPKQISLTTQFMLDELNPMQFRVDNKSYDVLLELDKPAHDLNEIYLTTKAGHQIPLSSIASLRKIVLPKEIIHRDLFRASEVFFPIENPKLFEAKLNEIKAFLKENLPPGYSFSLSSNSEKFQETSSTLLNLLLLALLFIYCILAIQFENLIDPLVILITVPLAISGALFMLWAKGMTLNIFSQIGLITLIGLITKHGVLIIDFTNSIYSQGKSLKESIIEATVLRLKPIFMTTATMILSIIPLILSKGAGAEIRQAIGYVLISGLFAGTIFTLTLFPTCCLLLKNTQRKKHYNMLI